MLFFNKQIYLVNCIVFNCESQSKVVYCHFCTAEDETNRKVSRNHIAERVTLHMLKTKCLIDTDSEHNHFHKFSLKQTINSVNA